ncbi:complexin-3-like isoform X1 [Acipenser oxyrinchus oxyrinchus]|uniref:Complexin-3-like isoform X1 n=1 Tax=Acipenser oxyrinchus oxyrinchus TaxID=40147 RepID=A0AAD8CWD3_ACIOX|nr:complexin-3-like isoform X1 [Acipenser oxyrinchus oxyrinchus]
MAFMVKSMVGSQLKNLTKGLGGGDEKPEGESSEAAAQRMTTEELEEYQKQLVEEKMERDASFAQKKAERATVRSHFRDKYRLPKNELDDTQIQLAGDEVELPKELAKMIAEDNEEEEVKDSVIGQLASIQNLDLDSLKDKAQATIEELKQTAEKCSVIFYNEAVFHEFPYRIPLGHDSNLQYITLKKPSAHSFGSCTN